MDYNTVKKRLLQIPKEDIFGGKCNLEDIEDAEKKLGNKLPNSFRQYLLDFGYNGIDGIVILVVGKNIVKGYDLIHNAFREWEGFKPDYFIPKYFIPFSPTGTGDYDCFDTRFFDKGECPVVLYCHDDFDDYTKNIAIPEKTHNNFVEWLNDAVDIYLSEK